MWHISICFLHLNDRTIYNMCTQKPPHDYSQQLYDKYKESFDDYITSTVSRFIVIYALYIMVSLLILDRINAMLSLSLFMANMIAYVILQFPYDE